MKQLERKVVYLSYDGLTDPLGQSQILPYLNGIKQKTGFNILIISFEKEKNFKLNRNKIKSILKRNSIKWKPLKYTKRPLILSTIWDLFKLNKAIKDVNLELISLIHCRSYITSIIALKLHRKNKIPFIFDMRGFYPDERVDGKIWNIKYFIFKQVYKFFKQKEKEFLQKSHHIVSLTKTGKNEIESWNLPNQSPISVIPCCTDGMLFKRENIIPLRKEIGIAEDDLVISYVGSLGTWYMLDEMLDFFKQLQNKRTNAKFLFITKDNPNQILNKVKEKYIDTNSIIIQPSTREMMPSYIGASNFSIFFILPVFSKKASSPTKMGEIMNLGIPVICNTGVGDVEKIMNKSIPELLIHEFSFNEYNRVIDLILDNFEINTEKIINTSIQYYSLENGIEKYISIYNSILEN